MLQQAAASSQAAKSLGLGDGDQHSSTANILIAYSLCHTTKLVPSSIIIHYSRWLLISTPRPTALDNAVGTSTADSSKEQDTL
ncbi:hypothetical protein E2562_035468 [Oryza meyeriana var. granulata]|uniref:Uncharacterized protein n=1 Tax=Oryza meyeriana var. granulata TaxID=110450 RepID=A0A6G1CKY4_9ORYZ|nr:hypothetical protein E2562_035468 [Oryza meyeriana var. granulata]